MTIITKVALAGATGNLGPAIFDGLLEAGFKVSVLHRKSSTHHTFPPSVTALPVDYESLDSLVDALKGQDAFVSTLGSAALATQVLLVKAAAKAHVKRFIPSEFGANTSNANTRALPFFKDKITVQDALTKEANTGNITYTLISAGPFLDWGSDNGFILNVKEKSITIYDGGDQVFSATSLPTVGKAVASVLKHFELTKNRHVYVQDTATTLNKLLAMAKKAVGAEGWKEEPVSTDELGEQAYAELKKDKPDTTLYAFNFLKISVWGKGYGAHFEQNDNEALGIKGMSDAEVQDLLHSLAK